MKIIRPESEKKEVPLKDGGVYSSNYKVLTLKLSAGVWKVWFFNEESTGTEMHEDTVRKMLENYTYHPNAELVLEPKR